MPHEFPVNTVVFSSGPPLVAIGGNGS
jgi:hypothetical protein